MRSSVAAMTFGPDKEARTASTEASNQNMGIRFSGRICSIQVF